MAKKKIKDEDIEIEVEDDVNYDIEVEEVNLEDLIILGEDKLLNIRIDFPKKNGETVVAKAKIKQLTMKQLKGIDLEKIDLATSIKVLQTSLYQQDEKPFPKQLILELPIGVVNAVTNEILRISGMKKDMGF